MTKLPSGWLRKGLLGLGATLGLALVAGLSAQGLQNVWQNLGGHETLVQRAMTAFQTTYAVLGPLSVWLVWQRDRLAQTAVLAWAAALVIALLLIIPAWAPEESDQFWLFLGAGVALALIGWGGMWCLSRLRAAA